MLKVRNAIIRPSGLVFRALAQHGEEDTTPAALNLGLGRILPSRQTKIEICNSQNTSEAQNYN